jgi:hypothetical protein
MMTTRVWLVNDPHFDENGRLIDMPPTEYTEAQILEEYWEYWKGRMEQKYGSDYEEITPENCIDDWVVVNWAWEKPNGN